MDVQDESRDRKWIPKDTRVKGAANFETSGTGASGLRIPATKTRVAVPAKTQAELKSV
jgi:hypothetical protein